MQSSPRRRPGGLPFAVFVAIAVVLTAGVAAAITTDGKATGVATGPTSTTERHPATTVGTVTTTTSAPSPERDAVDRSTNTAELLLMLDRIPLRPEPQRSGYDRSLFRHWDDVDHDGCDTRCEVLASQHHGDGTWLSEWDGYVTNNPDELEVDHVVALAEAWDSGANTWTTAQRDEFADYRPNLLAVTASENERKSDRDAAEWFPSRRDADCLFASTVVRVKTKWALSVDQAEHDALANLLHTCPGDVEPTTTTTTTVLPPPTTVFVPPAPPAPVTVAPTPAPDCTPGYDPCIPPGPDVDCSSGSGNGPRYVDGPVSVSGGDPYDLDRDRDGVGCES